MGYCEAQVGGFVQDGSNSSALAMALLQCCVKLSTNAISADRFAACSMI